MSGTMDDFLDLALEDYEDGRSEGSMIDLAALEAREKRYKKWVDGLRCSKLPLGVRREDFLSTQEMDVEAREEEDDDILLGSDEEEDFTNDYLEDDSEFSIEEPFDLDDDQ